MPTYAYACKDCGHAFEIVQSFSDNSLTECPDCHHQSLRKQFNSVGVVFKGSGFYRTDSRDADKKSGSTSTDSGKTSESAKSTSSDSTSSGGSSESKTSTSTTESKKSDSSAPAASSAPKSSGGSAA